VSEPIVRQPDFADDLRALLNRHSVENRSDTPDFILAAFLQNVLIDYEHAVRARDRWWGHEPSQVAGMDFALQVVADQEEDGRV
jgi:hypothetical protein